jgi:hypothetical protein
MRRAEAAAASAPARAAFTVVRGPAEAAVAEAGEAAPPWRALVFIASDADADAAIRWVAITVILAAAAVLAALCA